MLCCMLHTACLLSHDSQALVAEIMIIVRGARIRSNGPGTEAYRRWQDRKQLKHSRSAQATWDNYPSIAQIAGRWPEQEREYCDCNLHLP